VQVGGHQDRPVIVPRDEGPLSRNWQDVHGGAMARSGDNCLVTGTLLLGSEPYYSTPLIIDRTRGRKEMPDENSTDKWLAMAIAEIAQELNVSVATVEWLVTRTLEKEAPPPADVKIGWRSIGVRGRRINLISEVLVDIVIEEMEKMDQELDAVCGVAINGIPFATMLSSSLDTDLVIVRPHVGERLDVGILSSNFASVAGKKVVVIDDVIGTGRTMTQVLGLLREAGANPILCVVVVNKTSKDNIEGVPLRALIRARTVL
jgi:orotate phosphoribosyltransferase